jgi:hypothetical protein
MEIVYSIFIGIIFDMIVGMIDGIGLQCRHDKLGRHETENLRTPLLYAPPRLPRPFEAIKYLSFAAIARN